MSVARALNLTRDHVRSIIRARWTQWSNDLPNLGLVQDPERVDRWLFEAGPADADRVLQCLARLAASDGQDDNDAAMVLAWVLLPGVCTVARRYSNEPDVDQHLAAHLWIEIKLFSWQSTTRVAANLIGRVRKRLSQDVVAGHLNGEDPVAAVDDLESRRRRWAWVGLGMPAPGPGESADLDAATRLANVLEWGIHHGAITHNDRLLLLDLIAVATTEPTRPGQSAALLGDKVSDAVGVSWGVSGRTVRRKASASITRLAQAAGHTQALSA